MSEQASTVTPEFGMTDPQHASASTPGRAQPPEPETDGQVNTCSDPAVEYDIVPETGIGSASSTGVYVGHSHVPGEPFGAG